MSDTSLEPLHKTQLFFPIKPGLTVRTIKAKSVQPKLSYRETGFVVSAVNENVGEGRGPLVGEWPLV